MKMIRVLAMVMMVLAVASVASADKVLTYFTVVLTDVDQVWFQRDNSSPTGWIVRAHTNVRASIGAGYASVVQANATAGQKTSIEQFITNNVIPATNTQEGL